MEEAWARVMAPPSPAWCSDRAGGFADQHYLYMSCLKQIVVDADANTTICSAMARSPSVATVSPMGLPVITSRLGLHDGMSLLFLLILSYP
jgi:hypothetical protein